MSLSWRLCAIISALCLSFASVNARSQRIGPLSYLSLIENPNIQTPSHRVHAFSHFDVQFSQHQRQQRVKLSLEPNHDILPEGASVQYLNAAGEVTRSELVNRREHKVFKGGAWIQEFDGSWTHCGWARIVVRRDGVDPLFEGVFTIFGDHHHIKLRSNYLSSKHVLDPDLELSDDEYMVMFRDSDIGNAHSELKRSELRELSCQSNQLSFNSNPSHPIFKPELKRSLGSWGSAPIASFFGKRQIDNTPSGGNSGGVNLKQTIGNTAGCPTSRKVALIGVVTDCTYTGSFNSSQTAHQNVITQINSASDVYERTFNITLGLRNLTVSEDQCPGSPPAATPWNIGCDANTTITDRLNIFSEWRGGRNDSNAYWTLLTNCATGAEVGLAWLGQACVNDVNKGEGETVSGANVVAKTPTEWQVIAHETGHTFGAVHDCDSAQCANSNTVNAQQCCPLSASNCDAGAKYIMNPSTGDGITGFSPCSVGNICSAMGRSSVKTTCLSDNKGVTTISPQQCGNGIVEDGEDCDCGGTETCANNQCCDAQTCKFKSSAVCDDSNDDCCKSCQFASADTVCRASTGVCDPQETCSGQNATCPADHTAPDGQTCGNGTSTQCASGQCTSRDQQCKTLMGSLTQNNDTYACNSQDCTLSCASPEFGYGVCYSMQQNFLDGTVCGGGGKCSNGQCKGSSAGKEFTSWINHNKPLVIGLAAGVGGLLLLSILCCCIRRCRRPKRVRSNTRSAPMQQRWVGAPPPQGRWYPNQQRGPPWGGNQYWQQPPPPIPQQYVQPSVRYA
ncbi:hypothetical protein MMC22_007345 [Lobaria immixta]|nr:hypothetical protein [Lobaria immixta]